MKDCPTEERDAVKDRAKELRAEAKAGKDRAAGEKIIEEAIAALEGDDRTLAEGFRRVVGEVAPQLFPKTYYGMPAFANAEGKVVVFLQPASKFKARYSTLGFEGPAKLDDGDMWPTAFAAARLVARCRAPDPRPRRVGRELRSPPDGAGRPPRLLEFRHDNALHTPAWRALCVWIRCGSARVSA